MGGSDSQVVLKTLMVFHRILREGSEVAVSEVQHLAARERFLTQLASYKDDSSLMATQLSSWLRLYAKYLEEKVPPCVPPPLPLAVCVSGGGDVR
jgi:hypothetical protein